MDIKVRKRIFTRETAYHEGGPVQETPLKLAWAGAVVENPHAGRYEENLLPFMAALRGIGKELAEELADDLGKENVEVYGKAAIVGANGELEHGAVWHEAGGWAMREVLGQPKAIVPSSKAVGQMGYRVLMPMHNIHACYVRSHFNTIEVGCQDGPRPNEILFALGMGTGGRIHSRLGGLKKEDIVGEDGQR